jgi:hypothetical protein
MTYYCVIWFMLGTSLIGYYFTVLSTYVFQNGYIIVKTDSTITICTFSTYNLVTAVLQLNKFGL